MTTLILSLFAVVAAVVALWLLLPHRRFLPRPTQHRSSALAMQPPHVPSGTFIDGGHSWMRIAPDGAMAVGLDAFLAQALGTVDRVVLPEVGRWLNRGDPLLEVYLGGRCLTVGSPVEGEVQRVNEALSTSPESLTRDPYGEGWAATIWSRNHQGAIRPLKIGPPAISFLLREVKLLVEFLPSSDREGARAMLADGGLPRRGCLASLESHRWSEFQGRFLKVEDRYPSAE